MASIEVDQWKIKQTASHPYDPNIAVYPLFSMASIEVDPHKIKQTASRACDPNIAAITLFLAWLQSV